jgi:hypothetical protein
MLCALLFLLDDADILTLACSNVHRRQTSQKFVRYNGNTHDIFQQAIPNFT